MYHRSIILILTNIEVGVQPCTLKGWLWFPCRISMDTGGGIWNKWQHIIACRFQTYLLIFLSPSHYVVAVYEWLRVIRASYSPAVTVHLQMIQMQILTGGTELLWSGGGGDGGGAGCEKKCEKWSPAESDLAALLLCITMSGPVFILETKLRETRKSFFKKTHLSSMAVLARLPSYTLTGVSHLNFRV